METIPAIFSQFAVQAPLFLVWIGGMAAAVVYWQRHPRISLLVLIACAGFLVETAFGIYITALLPSTLIRQGQSAERIGFMFGVIGFVRSLIQVALWVLVLFAIFHRRGEGAKDL